MTTHSYPPRFENDIISTHAVNVAKLTEAIRWEIGKELTNIPYSTAATAAATVYAAILVADSRTRPGATSSRTRIAGVFHHNPGEASQPPAVRRPPTPSRAASRIPARPRDGARAGSPDQPTSPTKTSSHATTWRTSMTEPDERDAPPLTGHLHMRWSQQQRRAATTAARQAGMKLSQWIRDRAIQPAIDRAPAIPTANRPHHDRDETEAEFAARINRGTDTVIRLARQHRHVTEGTTPPPTE